MDSKKIGFLMALPPSHTSAKTVHDLARAALNAGHEVYLYLIDEGVKNIHTNHYRALAQAGARVFACAYGCQQHHVPTATLDPKMSLCGLVMLSGIIDACDPFLSFT
ncbi:MAG: DsrE family protein [Nitrospira sp.]|nr:DsrE family protein [Nitrospira sp.]